MLGNNRGKKIEKYTSDYVVFDLETTGISSTYDEVIEISGVKVRNRQVVDEFTSLVNPGRSIPYGASQVNGITDAMVMSAPSFGDVLGKFFEFLGDDVLVGHNIHNFDMRFIYRDAERFYGKVPENDYIDTLSVARNYLPQLSHYRLVDLASFYHISVRGAHRALNDCRMNQQVFEHLAKEMEGTQSGNTKLKLCLRCGQPMKKRNGRYGEFWGCSGYPNCRYTENI
ncbi:exonuclease domain-containing protein [Bariatricus sp. SGI.154]|uniref:3'-5' exonuclease n=1 Tax=Bariatricus sp. SGI.154 TaxID=3420549 RepID=UPI003D00B43A